MRAGLWWKMSRLIVFGGSGSDSDSDSCSGSDSGSGSGSAWHRAQARHSSLQVKKGNVVENARLMKLKMMKMMRGRFSHEFFFSAHGWSSAIYKRRNGTSIKYSNKFKKNAPCMRLPRLCRVDTVKRVDRSNKDPEPTFRKRWLLLVEEGHQKEGKVR